MSDAADSEVTATETPTGWLATADNYPRLGVIGATRVEALANLRQARETWRQLREAPAPA